ncbi:hypothetical protein MA16_Dca019670 [Dendrobium catenatum]|uniref:Uncharacterized protein n=1 Tax=Dendrobium catenatum TaxID=906689 RepID=A0A2I0X184_9ASPA|nr:hypothetical protein MA16_Dca019670 [Dendrobium catenatum]
MNASRPTGPLRPNGRGSNGIVIREGELPRCRQAPVDGNGKKVLVENMVGKEIFGVKGNPGLAILELSASDDLILRENNFSGVLDTIKGYNIDDDLSSVEVLKENEVVDDHTKEPMHTEFWKNKSNEVKLSKELRSLGPVDVDYKKKKSPGNSPGRLKFGLIVQADLTIVLDDMIADPGIVLDDNLKFSIPKLSKAAISFYFELIILADTRLKSLVEDKVLNVDFPEEDAKIKEGYEDALSQDLNLIVEPLVAQNSNFDFNPSQALVAENNADIVDNGMVIDPFENAKIFVDQTLIAEDLKIQNSNFEIPQIQEEDKEADNSETKLLADQTLNDLLTKSKFVEVQNSVLTPTNATRTFEMDDINEVTKGVYNETITPSTISLKFKKIVLLKDNTKENGSFGSKHKLFKELQALGQVKDLPRSRIADLKMKNFMRGSSHLTH